MTIPYARQWVDEDDIAAVVDALRGDRLTQGPRVAEFERAVADVCQVAHAVAFSSGTAALHGAAFAAGLAPGDDFVTSALTFAASANCGVYLGATPRFADIEPATWNVSADTVGAVLTPETKAVIPVHFAGLPAPIREIRAVLPEDVVVIEDAAHALGARSANEPVGSCLYAHMAVFSFHPVKAITSAEGGMVTTRSDALAQRLRLFRNHGLTKDPSLLEHPDEGGWHQEQQELGFNYRLTDVQSALGLAQLRKLEAFVARRNEIAARYREEFAGMDALELPPGAQEGSLHAYHLFIVRHRGGAHARRALYDGLRNHGILAQVHYRPVYLHPYYRRAFEFAPGLCPEAERYYAGCLSLPCFPALSDIEQHEVIAAVADIVRYGSTERQRKRRTRAPSRSTSPPSS